MRTYFDEKKWKEAVKRADWYLELYPEYERLMAEGMKLPLSERETLGESIYSFYEHELNAGNIALGTSGKNLDAERKPIDTVVIHHTKCPPGISWQRLDAMHLIRLYAKSYYSPTTEKEIQGKPVWSGHFRPGGRQVFYAYHWLVRMDGSVERLLSDNETGWQAGNWDINCRSAAICLDNDFERSTPPDTVLAAAADIIKKNYAHVAHERIIGHREANPHTTCPSEQFLNGWKKALIELAATK